VQGETEAEAEGLFIFAYFVFREKADIPGPARDEYVVPDCSASHTILDKERCLSRTSSGTSTKFFPPCWVVSYHHYACVSGLLRIGTEISFLPRPNPAALVKERLLRIETKSCDPILPSSLPDSNR